jgi:hypothetical protein
VPRSFSSRANSSSVAPSRERSTSSSWIGLPSSASFPSSLQTSLYARSHAPCTLLRVLPQRPHPSQIPPPHTFFRFLYLGSAARRGVAEFHAIVLEPTYCSWCLSSLLRHVSQLGSRRALLGAIESARRCAGAGQPFAQATQRALLAVPYCTVMALVPARYKLQMQMPKEVQEFWEGEGSKTQRHPHPGRASYLKSKQIIH